MKILSERQRLQLMAQDCKEVLIGKVMPGDMDEGGSLAEYFAAKYLNAMRDLLDRDAQIVALAAENVALKDCILKQSAAVENWNSWADEEDKIINEPKTPVTDAAANALRAEGIDRLAEAVGNECSKLKVGSKQWKELKSMVFMLGDFASKLREGKA